MEEQKKQNEKDKQGEVIEEEPEEDEEEEEDKPVKYPIAPKYKLIHSYPVDYGQFWNDNENFKAQSYQRPKEFVFTVE